MIVITNHYSKYTFISNLHVKIIFKAVFPLNSYVYYCFIGPDATHEEWLPTYYILALVFGILLPPAGWGPGGGGQLGVSRDTRELDAGSVSI